MSAGRITPVDSCSSARPCRPMLYLAGYHALGIKDRIVQLILVTL